MSVSIDNVFIKQFEAEVHLAFQQMGTKLRSTVRTKNDVKGSSTTFQKRQDLREKLLEYSFVLVPNGMQIFIGTPHTLDTIYKV